jgi:CHAT domain-containing protein
MVLANPDFDKSGNYNSIQIASANRGTGERSTDLNNLQFSSLPGTAAEAQELAPLLPTATILTGSQATENALKQVNSPSILHVATHGFFLQDVPLVAPPSRGGIEVVPINNSPSETKTPTPGSLENPLLRSGLVLAGFNLRQSGTEDGVLTALEATGLDLIGTKLLVLSACQTGLGDVANGEGVYGLRRAFAIAGVESQVMSLWYVSDAGTKELMVKYYQRLLKGEGRSEALRQTQLEMLQSQTLNHPYYWATFIPSGDWTPAQF